MRLLIFIFQFVFLHAVLSAETKASTAMCSIEFNATTFLHNQIPVDHAPSALGFLATTESDAEDEDEISNNKNAFGCNSSKPINQLLTAVLPDFFAHAENCNPANCLPSHQTKFPQIAYSGYSAALRI